MKIHLFTISILLVAVMVPTARNASGKLLFNTEEIRAVNAPEQEQRGRTSMRRRTRALLCDEEARTELKDRGSCRGGLF